MLDMAVFVNKKIMNFKKYLNTNLCFITNLLNELWDNKEKNG
jgi:hypothetical protein